MFFLFKGKMTKRQEWTSQINRRLRRRIAEAFSFLVATAWADLFDELFTIIAGDSDSFLRKLLYAITFTVIAATLAVFLGDDGDDND